METKPINKKAKHFRVIIEELPDVDCQLLHILYGKKSVSLPIESVYSEELVKVLNLHVEPAAYDTY